MSATQLFEQPFFVLDSLATALVQMSATNQMNGGEDLRWRRIATSTGSADLSLMFPSGKVIWTIRLHALTANETLLGVVAPGWPEKHLDNLLDEIVDRIGRMPDILKNTSKLAPMPAPDGAQPRQNTPRDPKKGDSIKLWLDWRDREYQRTGRRPSLSFIARESGHGLSTLKKYSSERSRGSESNQEL